MTEVERKAADILTKVVLVTIGITQENGTPHVFTAYVAVDDALDMYFVSERSSLHGRLLKFERRAAVAVYDSRQDWDDWKEGVQLWGQLRLASAKEKLEGRTRYERRFPEYRKWIDGEGKSSDKEDMYRFEWDRMKVLAEADWGEEEFRETVRTRLSR